MKDKEIKIQKICGFYVNDWHFTTMILPYMRKEIEGNKKVITFFQNTIESNIKEMLSKMNLNKAFEEKILEINWNKANSLRKEEIKQTLESTNKNIQATDLLGKEENKSMEARNGNTQTIDILVKGENKFIETINGKIETAIQELNFELKVSIINFYDLSKNQEIGQITKRHKYVINTAGIQKIHNKIKKEKEA